VNTELVDRILAEYHSSDCEPDPVLSAVRLAILVENAFGVTLEDAQIDPDFLADPDSLRFLVTGPPSDR